MPRLPWYGWLSIAVAAVLLLLALVLWGLLDLLVFGSRDSPGTEAEIERCLREDEARE